MDSTEQKPPALFDSLARRYDDWFDTPRGAAIFKLELDCLRLIQPGFTGHWLEVGVGTGRFAQALGIGFGVDPSAAVLEYARRRGIEVQEGRGEQLPYPADHFSGALLVVTICFLSDPAAALAECARVLRPGGALVAGLVPADSPWGRQYQRQAAEGHPFYSAARFYRIVELTALATDAGFRLECAASTLLVPPTDRPPEAERPRSGLSPEAGFVALRYVLA